VRTDAMRLRQVLTNLVENGIRYTERGSVALELGVEDGVLRIQVRDSGVGIPADQIERIFEPFTQVDGSAGRVHGGVGLGLSICKRIVERMGGRIEVQSEVGRGTRFDVQIPVTPASDAPADDATPRVAPCLGGVRVLLADDSADNRKLIQYFLTAAGARVTTASNGREAVDAFLADPGAFDVIAMDMQMPELTGYEATRLLRDAGCQVPVLALTAHALAEHRDECLAAGCTDYLSKPVARRALVEAVRRLADMAEKAV
jgi:CheY-like chemotaxis protein/anti-sigma regulatory factor (Ser/Thr protein kinase)